MQRRRRPWPHLGSFAIAAAALVVPAPALALDPEKTLSEYRVEVLGARDGLTGAPIRSLSQGPDGALWIAAHDGLGWYDGDRVHRLPHGLGTDVAGAAWSAAGVVVAAPHAGPPLCLAARGSSPCLASGEALFPPGTRSFAVAADATGAVWMVTSAGVRRHVGGGFRPEFPGASLPPGEITAVARDDSGRLWLGSTTGLYLEQGGRFVRPPGPAGAIRAAVRAISQRPRGALWVVTGLDLVRIAGQDVTFHSQRALPHGWRTSGLEDRDGSFWIGSQVGLIRYSRGNFTRFTRSDGLPDEDVTALFEDREGSLWVGGRNGTVAQLTDRTVLTSAAPPSLRQTAVESTCEDGAGTMWFGSWLGLTRWRDGQERTFTAADGLPHDHVFAVQPDGTEGDALWVGTERGLVRWRNGRVQGSYLHGTAISSLYVDRAKTLWIGTSQGLLRLREGAPEPVPAAPAPLSPGQIRGLAEDGEGTLWASSERAGLLRVDRGGGLVQAQSLDPDARRATRGLFRDGDGTLWFGAGTTLVRLRSGRTTLFGAGAGLPADVIYQVLADGDGRLWVATSRGILAISRASLDEVVARRRQRVVMTSFETSDRGREIAARRSRTPGAWRSRDGRLWFATLRGVATIDPRRVRLNTVPPAVRIREALVDGRAATAAGPNVFPAGRGSLEVHFSAVTLVEPHKATHRYRLEGFDDQWVDAGTRRSAYYTNLSPGRYRFRVQASNADGLWNEEGALVALELTPYLHQTGWFYLLCALAAAGTAWGLHRARVAHLRAQDAAVYAERTRMARELHDSLLQGMAAVAMQLRSIRKRISRAEPIEPLALQARLEGLEGVVDASLQDTRQFVWSLRDSGLIAPDELGVSLQQLVDRVTAGSRVIAQVMVDAAVPPLRREVYHDLVRITQEALVNAVRHSGAGQVEVRVSPAPDGVRLRVADDGRGFDPVHAPGMAAGHFGLRGMQERASALGTLSIDSRPGGGTVIGISVNRRAWTGGHV